MFFGLAGGLRVERVVGPVVLFILAAELFFDLMIGVFPEAVQVSGNLHRAVCRREKFDGHRYGAVKKARGLQHTEELLQPDGEKR
jgi:hypothetical protein